MRDYLLVAQPFDLKRLAFTGDAVPVIDNVQAVGTVRRGIFDAAPGGMLIALNGAEHDSNGQLTWLDRKGNKLGAVGEKGAFMAGIEPSPDSRQVAVQLLDSTGNFDLWIADLARGTRTRFTFDPAADLSPVWTPDGKWIYWTSLSGGKTAIHRRPADGSGADAIFLVGAARTRAISPDGKWLLGGLPLPMDGNLVLINLNGEPKLQPFVPPQALPPGRMMTYPSFSPDGRWLLYTSDETGREEIYVTRFLGPGAAMTGKRQISTTGGGRARWRSDGREIIFVTSSREVFSVDVKPGENSIDSGKPVKLFDISPSMSFDFVLSPDGNRILTISQERAGTAPSAFTLIQNWPAILRH
ncbi:MAG TPA: hypothetical protein VLJ39_19500 [Tepidisphaeraceae bacterium]|nr:hypothetical protein [Tepidisphaeraceae bacterium]